MYVCMYVCMYVSLSLSTYICMCIYIYIHMYTLSLSLSAPSPSLGIWKRQTRTDALARQMTYTRVHTHWVANKGINPNRNSFVRERCSKSRMEPLTLGVQAHVRLLDATPCCFGGMSKGRMVHMRYVLGWLRLGWLKLYLKRGAM